MRPVRLELEGFGAFRDATVVDFGDIELVALVGRTGSGKSTIIDALTFALYGSVARYDDNRAVAPVINQTSTRARVRLDFESGGERYTAVRLVQRQGSGATTKEARLERGEEVLAADARGMTAAITELLGLDAAQFNRTIVLPQGRFADFLHDEPGKRQETLRGLLGLGVYRDVASAARRQGAERRAQVEALRADDESDATELTDDRRATLVMRREALAEGRSAFIEAVADIEARQETVVAAARELDAIDEHLALVSSIQAPESLDALDRQLDEAAAGLVSATDAVASARDRRRRADAAVAAAPDVASTTRDLAARRDAERLAAEQAEAAAALAAAEERLAAARVQAERVAGRQQELDEIATAARAEERDARERLDAGPGRIRVEHWQTLRRRRAGTAAALDEQTRATDAAAQHVAPLRIECQRTQEAEAAARARRDEVQQRAGAAGYAGLLDVGGPCPLCLQAVTTLPRHHVAEDVTAATSELEKATRLAAEAAARLTAAERAEREARAHVQADRRTLDELDAELAGTPDDPRLADLLTAVANDERALDTASRRAARAEAAATAHRSAPTTRQATEGLAYAEREAAGLRALDASLRVRRDAAHQAAAGLPSLEACAEALAEAERLAGERDEASLALAAAEDEQAHATSAQRAAEAAQEEAIDALRAARDRVAALAPPTITGDRIGASWAALLDWATSETARIAGQRSAVRRRLAAATDEASQREATARAAVAALGVDEAGDASTVRDRLVSAEASSTADLEAFDRGRRRHAARAERIDRLDAERAVAEQLGHLLRSDGFEAWLMEAALSELVDDAGRRVRELSSGQFSLELVGRREVMVRDHANADELRGARTLSGGETFLASLALALALADATSELASEGSPSLESIFLDEGFGTLDPTTLDVVASAIEELGSAGRLVAVVTHIRELADRMPVRFEVAKVGSSSMVERVDA